MTAARLPRLEREGSGGASTALPSARATRERRLGSSSSTLIVAASATTEVRGASRPAARRASARVLSSSSDVELIQHHPLDIVEQRPSQREELLLGRSWAAAAQS